MCVCMCVYVCVCVCLCVKLSHQCLQAPVCLPPCFFDLVALQNVVIGTRQVVEVTRRFSEVLIPVAFEDDLFASHMPFIAEW